MKTIKRMDSESNWQYSRLKDDIAEQKVRHEGWTYCSKEEWKKNVRDSNKKED